MFSLSKQMIRC